MSIQTGLFRRRLMSRKTQIFILLLAWTAALILYGCSFQNQSGDTDGFTWSSDTKGETLPEMIPGQARSIQFHFAMGEGISKVRFEITDPDIKDLGISIRNETVPVKEGRAHSQAVFEIKDGTRPWSYKLEILARDAETDKVLGKGTVPFAVYPYFYNILNCSC
jgi:hypothetical protein